MPENVTNGVVNPASSETDQTENEEDVDPQFDPIVSLPLIDVSSNEEDEVEMIKLRAKLYRYESANDPAEWKERGTGEVKLLRHKTKHTVRVVMRRDKTLKICANHFVTPWMELKPNCGSDRAWVWSVLADFADEQLKPELLAIRFANAENASLWKEAFEKAKKIVGTECSIYSGKSNPEDEDNDNNSESDSYISYSGNESEPEEKEVKKETDETKLSSGADDDCKANDQNDTEKITEVLEKLVTMKIEKK